MISILFYGILVGLLPTVALAVLLALSQRDFAELESDYEQLKKQSRQLCSELEFERKKVAELKDRHQREVRRADQLQVDFDRTAAEKSDLLDRLKVLILDNE